MLSTDEIERGLTAENKYVRWGFAQRADFTPTEEQIERALVDRDGFLWLAFVNWGNNAD